MTVTGVDKMIMFGGVTAIQSNTSFVYTVCRQSPDAIINRRTFNRLFQSPDMLNVHLSNRNRYRRMECLFGKQIMKLFTTKSFTKIPLLNKK